MYQNLLKLHAVDEVNQETISVEDIYEITDTLSTLNIGKSKGKSNSPTEPTSSSNSVGDLEWPPHDEDFVITLDEEGWNLGCVQYYNSESDQIQVQSLQPLKTRAKDDQGQGRRYWIYAADETCDSYKRKHILDLRPSVSLAKNIKRKDPVFALLNREMVEALSQSLYAAEYNMKQFVKHRKPVNFHELLSGFIFNIVIKLV